MYSHSSGMYKNTDYEGCKTTSWNPDGSNMMFQDLSFPVFLLTNQTEVNFAIHDVRSLLKIFYAHHPTFLQILVCNFAKICIITLFTPLFLSTALIRSH